MKTTLHVLLTVLLAAAAHAGPFSPTVSAAIGCGVAATNRLHAATTPILTATPLAAWAAIPVAAAPVPVFTAPAPIRAASPR